jgi:hypothetical protein
MHSGDGVHGADTFMYAVRIIAQDGAPEVMRRPDARGANTGFRFQNFIKEKLQTQEMWILEFRG